MFVLLPNTASRLDARTRLAVVFVPAILVGLTLNPPALVVLTVVAIGVGLLARLSRADLKRAWLPLAIFCLVTLTMHLLFVRPHNSAAIDLGIFAVSEQALLTGSLYCWRIVLFAILALSFVRWVTPEEFVESIWRLILPLGNLGLPVQGVGMALTVAIRFIPQMLTEHKRIALAQRSRGASQGGSALARTRQALPLFVPTVSSAFRRIATTSDALVVRGWGIHPTRTFLRRSILGVADGALLAGLLLVIVVLVVI
jgi:energy-coupling factor transporter transmembrane protein EcfT